MNHAPFAPSSADRWMACPASFALSLPYPDPPSSEYSAEGTRLHDVASDLLQDFRNASIEDLAFLQPYIDHCTALMRKTTTDGWMIEERSRWNDLLHGTADFVAWGDSTLHVVDLKTGAGISVDPEENKQLMTYAGMVMNGADSYRHFLDLDKVVLTIVQPPAEQPVKSWVTTPVRIRQHMDEAVGAIERSLEPAQQPVPGEHCRWCKAKPTCPALTGQVAQTDTLPVNTLRPASMALWLDRADTLQQWIDALRTMAHTHAQAALSGAAEPIPGWTLKPKRAMRSWAQPEAVLALAKKLRVVEKIAPRALKSPAQAEKALGTLPPALADQVVAISSGTNLVRGEPPASTVAAPSLAQSLSNLKMRL